MSNKKRIVMKISGGNLRKEGSSFFNEDLIENLVSQIIEISKTYSIALVVGGGNIWRGESSQIEALKNQYTHHIGMIATIINGVVIKNFLSQKKIKSTLYSAFECPRVAKNINPQDIENSLNNDEIVIFSGGIGAPFVSTDTCAALRAIEIGAKKVFFGKDGVKGVYDKDPKKYQDAKFFKELSYSEIISKKIEVMDRVALFLAEKHKLELYLFNQEVKDSFLKTLNNQLEHTKIS